MMRTKLLAVSVALPLLMVGINKANSSDLEAITNLILDANAEAVALNRDAQELNSYTRSTISWQIHAAKLNEMKEHANKAARIVQDMNNRKRPALRGNVSLLRESCRS
jgi:phosphoenolpyruvate-protein kinase (PTS system EI component)